MAHPHLPHKHRTDSTIWFAFGQHHPPYLFLNEPFLLSSFWTHQQELHPWSRPSVCEALGFFQGCTTRVASRKKCAWSGRSVSLLLTHPLSCVPLLCSMGVRSISKRESFHTAGHNRGNALATSLHHPPRYIGADADSVSSFSRKTYSNRDCSLRARERAVELSGQPTG